MLLGGSPKFTTAMDGRAAEFFPLVRKFHHLFRRVALRALAPRSRGDLVRLLRVPTRHVAR